MRPNRSPSQRLFSRFLGSLATLLLPPVGAFSISQLTAQAVQLRPHIGLYVPTRISVQKRELQVQQKVGVQISFGLGLPIVESAP